MSPKVDWGQVEEREFGAVPAGTYVCRFTGYENKGVSPNSKTGDEYYSFEFSIDEGQYANQKLWDNFSLAPKALFALKRALLALGADPADVSPGSDRELEEIFDDLIGTECRLKVTVRRAYSETRGEDIDVNDVKGVYAAAVAV